MKYHMRLVVTKLAESGKITPLDDNVCVDVVFRGESKEAIEAVKDRISTFLDAGAFYGDWAGIGRGAFTDRETITIS